MNTRSQRRLASLALALLAAAFASARAAEPLVSADDEASAYAAFGAIVARGTRLAELNLSDAQFAAFVTGLRSIHDGGALPPLDPAAAETLEALRLRIAQLPAPAAPGRDERLAQYLHSARQGLQMRETDSGLLYRIDHAGGGPRPRASDVVVINLVARTPDLTTEITQLSRHNLRTKVSDLLPGLAEGALMLTLGARALFILPPNLSFGADAWPVGLEPGMPLVFEVELVEIAAAQ